MALPCSLRLRTLSSFIGNPKRRHRQTVSSLVRVTVFHIVGVHLLRRHGCGYDGNRVGCGQYGCLEAIVIKIDQILRKVL